MVLRPILDPIIGTIRRLKKFGRFNFGRSPAGSLGSCSLRLVHALVASVVRLLGDFESQRYLKEVSGVVVGSSNLSCFLIFYTFMIHIIIISHMLTSKHNICINI